MILSLKSNHNWFLLLCLHSTQCCQQGMRIQNILLILSISLLIIGIWKNLFNISISFTVLFERHLIYKLRYYYRQTIFNQLNIYIVHYVLRYNWSCHSVATVIYVTFFYKQYSSISFLKMLRSFGATDKELRNVNIETKVYLETVYYVNKTEYFYRPVFCILLNNFSCTWLKLYSVQLEYKLKLLLY